MNNKKYQKSEIWSDNINRNGWSAEYHDIASTPSFIQAFIKMFSNETLKTMSQSLFTSNPVPQSVVDFENADSGMTPINAYSYIQRSARAAGIAERFPTAWR